MVLYRKYRPTSFQEVVGNDHVKSTLISSVKSNQVSSGYLFSGPRGTGKTSLARIFAKAINCENFHEKDDVCNRCLSCDSINKFASTDVVEIDAASNRGVDDIRNLKDSANYLPNQAKYKVYIIDEVHMLTPVAFNAFLKTLEEPPPNVIFIMATTEPNKIPTTILSRVQRYDLQFQTEEAIIQKLQRIIISEKRSYPDYVLKKIFRMTGGSFRDAESLLAKILASEVIIDSEEVLNNLLGVNNNETVEKFISVLIDSIDWGLNQDTVKHLDALILSSGNPVELFDEAAAQLNQMLTDSLIDIESYVLISKILLNIKINSKFVKKSSLVNLAILYIQRELRPTNNDSISLRIEKSSPVEDQVLEKKASCSNDALSVERDNSDKNEIQQLPPMLKNIIDKATQRGEGHNIYIQVKDKKHLVELKKPRNLSIICSLYKGKHIEIVYDSTIDSDSKLSSSAEEVAENIRELKEELSLDEVETENLPMPQPSNQEFNTNNKNIVEQLF